MIQQKVVVHLEGLKSRKEIPYEQCDGKGRGMMCHTFISTPARISQRLAFTFDIWLHEDLDVADHKKKSKDYFCQIQKVQVS